MDTFTVDLNDLEPKVTVLTAQPKIHNAYDFPFKLYPNVLRSMKLCKEYNRTPIHGNPIYRRNSILGTVLSRFCKELWF